MIEDLKNELQKFKDQHTETITQLVRIKEKAFQEQMIVKEIEKKINILIAKNKNITIADEFISKNPDSYYISSSNDHQDVHARCIKCDEYFELFGYQTGIGETIIGVCPECKTEVDFSNYNNW